MYFLKYEFRIILTRSISISDDGGDEEFDSMNK